MTISEEEKQFFAALKDVFVGVKVEGVSGYINLMVIKTEYLEKVLASLRGDIERKTKQFPEFKRELFEKLYGFFKRYFNRTGSLYFANTPFYEGVYERVYTDKDDVSLFWKTHMLYYVKSERLFRSMSIDVGGLKLFFDASEIQHKKAWEKKELIYELKTQSGRITLLAKYSERGRKTDVSGIVRSLKRRHPSVTDDVLETAFNTFEKQSEVDYFINKNAKMFLREQLKLWFDQYVFSDESEFTASRISQLKVLHEIAYSIIDFIAQFEDELCRMWNKPKFVLGSNYVVTLDRIAAREGGIPLIRKVLEHKNLDAQVSEWRDLGIIDARFNQKEVLTRSLDGDEVAPEFRAFPIDTKNFKDLELDLIGLFAPLDDALDGWLISSENYQALNTILQKFRSSVQTIYIDPPFNKEQDADYLYNVKFKDSTWLTILENRLRLARDLLKPEGSIFVRCDHNGNMYVRLLMNEVFGRENFRNEIAAKRGRSKAGLLGQFKDIKSLAVAYDNLYWYSRSPETRFTKFWKEASEEQKTKGKWHPFYKKSPDRRNMQFELLGVKITKGQWKRGKERAFAAVKNYEEYLKASKETGETLEQYWKRTGEELEFVRKEDSGTVKFWVPPREEILQDNNWLVIPGYSSTWEFETENSETIVEHSFEPTSKKGDLVMDFFLGSGTSTAVAHKLGRKWIGVELGEHFHSRCLPRMKEVLAGKGKHEPCGITPLVKWKGGGFFKYYELEQYENTLQRVRYEDSEPLAHSKEKVYPQYVFLKDKKLLDAIEIDYDKNKVRVDLGKLYENVDLPETISNLLGKPIRRIEKEVVEFMDGTKINTKDLNYKLIKPLVWW